MIVAKAPMRISLFGGSTDYESFYKNYGSFLIGTTINKYAYSILRYRPTIVGNESVVTYSKIERVKTLEEIKNPLIRETLKYYGINKPIELNFATDVPSRTGLGGSSSCCVSLIKAIGELTSLEMNKYRIATDAIHIERKLLNEPGGVQDQIWACYGGFNTISINTDGQFVVNPIKVSYDFMRYFESSLMLIYSEQQRASNSIAQSHDEKDKQSILNISRNAVVHLQNENVQLVGELLYQSWMEKRNLSKLISNDKIDMMIDDIIHTGAYGAKLLGTGGAGFVLVICDRNVKKKLKEKYNDNIIDFEFENEGVTHEVI
jgi:D-glycero-alpha-D-manno-heptose-7-phosphate kinase